ncbi:unnamed protein product [Ostreobium quekettii]|uniref:STI1 domain-containing protein n=1 Tax=Ostreobium quekettii TaxID=121088 RepID=A0A8S1JG28_9CHLO|nr:unnamed protein product [Ostreobium quekettii]|eukprot:evm.model.scf_2796.1 EVM.evm.TU.scf_2796.1   scf_2796:1519-3273(+)
MQSGQWLPTVQCLGLKSAHHPFPDATMKPTCLPYHPVGVGALWLQRRPTQSKPQRSVFRSKAASGSGPPADAQSSEYGGNFGTYQGVPAGPPQYPVAPPPVVETPSGLPPWVWILVGVLLASFFNKVANFLRSPQQAMSEMMFKQMSKSMGNQPPEGPAAGQPNPFFSPGAGFPGMGPPPVDTTATPVTPVGTQAAPPPSMSGAGGQTGMQQEYTPPAQPAAGTAPQSSFDPAGPGATMPGATAAGAPTAGVAPSDTLAADQAVQPSTTSRGFFSDVGRQQATTHVDRSSEQDENVEWLFNMLKDPQMRESLAPFLPEQMRDPDMLDAILANPVVKEQMKTMFTPEMLSKMKEYQGSINDPQLKAQLEGMNVSPDVLMQKLMGEPELMSLLQKPNVMEAVMDMNSNPENMSKYMNDSEVMKVMMKMSDLTMQAQMGTQGPKAVQPPPPMAPQAAGYQSATPGTQPAGDQSHPAPAQPTGSQQTASEPAASPAPSTDYHVTSEPADSAATEADSHAPPEQTASPTSNQARVEVDSDDQAVPTALVVPVEDEAEASIRDDEQGGRANGIEAAESSQGAQAGPPSAQ